MLFVNEKKRFKKKIFGLFMVSLRISDSCEKVKED
jgi:hypothetical protein